MTYTDEELKQIEDAAKEYANEICAKKDTLGKCFAVEDFMSVYKSNTMQQIIESRIKAAKIELLEEIKIKLKQATTTDGMILESAIDFTNLTN